LHCLEHIVKRFVPKKPKTSRYDLRPFLYNSSWKWQFDAIDAAVERLEQQQAAAEKKKQNAIAKTPEKQSVADEPLDDDVAARVDAALRAAGVQLKPDIARAALLAMLQHQQ
jgi:hypothetical protein